MTKLRTTLFALWLFYCNGPVFAENYCPEKCVCRKIENAENADGLKVKCGGLPAVKLNSIKDVDFSSIKDNVVQLLVHN